MNPEEFKIAVGILIRRTHRMNYSDVDFYDDVKALLDITECEDDIES